jgi:hypothetical protein
MLPTSIESRDRDTAVTPIPVLIDAVPRERRDGQVVVHDDYDIAVRALPLDAPDMLLKTTAVQKLEREYNVVPEKKRAELMALLRLTQAIQTRKLVDLAAYVVLQSGADSQRWLAQERELRKTLGRGDKNWPIPGKEKVAKYEDESVNRLIKRARHPISEVSRQLNRWLRRVRFVIWWSERETRLMPGLYCQDMATALAALLFSRVASTKGLAVCERCGKRFVRTRRGQRFHSGRCGDADRKARQRAKQKGK